MNKLLFSSSLLVFILFTGITKAQIIKTKLDIVGGVSAREYAHIGLRYQYTDLTQIGLYIGGDLGLYSETIKTYAIDNLIHFGKHSYYSNRPVWYARQGFTLLNSRETDCTKKYSYINVALGRDMAVSDWLGFNIDLGIIAQIKKKTEYESSHNTEIENKLQWMPLMRFQVYFSF